MIYRADNPPSFVLFLIDISMCIDIQLAFRICIITLVEVHDALDDMMTSSNGNIFRITGHVCGKFTGLR